jgi:ribosomal protein S27AE
MVYFADSPVTTTARPVCSKCGSPMWLTRIEPDKFGFARRSFECPRCQHQMTEVIELGSAA